MKLLKALAALAARNADVLATSQPRPGLPPPFEEDTVTDEEIWHDTSATEEEEWYDASATEEEMYERGRKVRFHKQVRFHSRRVTSIATRPRTPKADLPVLFYSDRDVKRFRNEAEDLVCEYKKLVNMGVPAIDCLSVFPSDDPPCRAPPTTTATTVLVNELRAEDPMPMDIDVDDSNDTVANTVIPAVLQARLQWTNVPYVEPRPAIHSFTFLPPSEVNVPAFDREAVASTPLFIFGATRDVPCETSVILSDDPPGNAVESAEDNEEVDLAGLNDDQTDTSSDQTPTLSIPAGGAREVPPRETSTKGRRLRKELESSLDGRYWAVRSATRR